MSAEPAGSCLACARPLRASDEGEHHRSCLQRVFGAKRLPEIEVDPRQLHLFGLEMAGRVSISGVQRKVSLGLDGSALRVAAGGARFVLKPQETTFPALPENEFASLLLARAVGIEVPVFTLVRLSDGTLAFLSRRFDRRDDGRRLAMEDFCQLLELPPTQKYDSSHERCVEVVRRYSSEPLLDQLRLFRLFLFSWAIGNGDLHLKNLALLEDEPGRHRLSPAYDLLNTRVPIPGDPLALPLCGKRDRLRARDWLDLAERCRLPPEVVMDVCASFVRAGRELLAILHGSPLSEEHRFEYARTIVDRFNVLPQLFERARESSERAATRRRAPRAPTPADAARTAHLVRRAFEELGIPLADDSPLHRELTDLDWLGAVEGDLFSEGGPRATDPVRFDDALVRLVRLDRVRKAMARCSKLRGFSTVMRHLKNLTVPRAAREAGQAWDLLYELELASQLVAKHWTVELAEPDVVVRDGEGKGLGFACKRPRERANIPNAVERGVEQIARTGMSGIVAVDLGDVLPWSWIRQGAEVEAAKEIRRLLREELDTVLEEVAKRLPPLRGSEGDLPTGALGVLYTGTFMTTGREAGADRAWINSALHFEVQANPSLPEVEPLIEFFGNTLLLGQAGLRGEP